MRDLFFFPLAAAVAGAFVFVALDPYGERTPYGPVSAGGRNAQDLKIQKSELHRLEPGGVPGLKVTVGPSASGPIEVARIDRDPATAYDDPRRGVHLVLAEDVEAVLESRPIEVVIEARAVGPHPATQLEVNYFAKAGADSGWTAFDLSRDFQPLTLNFFTPKRGHDLAYDYLGLRPAAKDQPASVEIRSIRFHVLGPKSTPPPKKATGPLP